MIEILILAGLALAGLGSAKVVATDAGERLRAGRKATFAARAATLAETDPAPFGDPYRTAVEEGSPLVTPAMEAAFRRAMLARELGFDAEGYSLRASARHARKASTSGPAFERLRKLHLGEFRPPTRMERLRERFNTGIADAYARERLLREIAKEQRREYAAAARKKDR